jgi:hypothetical protein
MCKPSCCPGPASSGGVGGLVLAAGALVVAAAVARPVIHAAETLLRIVIDITLITLSTAAALALVGAVVLVTRRVRQARQLSYHVTVLNDTRQAVPAILARQETRPGRFELTAGQRADCLATGTDPDKVTQMIRAALRGAQ